MDLYLVRHGTAIDRADWDGADADRPLSDPGREEMARISSSVARLGLRIDAIVTSPYARAYETADILARHLNLLDKLVVDQALTPGFAVESLGGVLKKLPEPEGVVLVGHEPDFSTVVGQITGGRVVFKKGAIAQVHVAYPSLKKGELVWLVQPAFVGL